MLQTSLTLWSSKSIRARSQLKLRYLECQDPESLDPESTDLEFKDLDFHDQDYRSLNF